MSELIHKEKLQPIKKANLLEAQDHAIYEEVNYMKDRAARLKGSDPDYGESVINLAAAAIYSDGNSVELENSCQLLSSFQAIKPVKLAYRRKFLPSQAKEVLLQEERYTKKFPVGVQMADVDGEI